MKGFSGLSKSAFWSQFLFGIVAIFALPAVSSIESIQTESVANQQILRLNELSSIKLNKDVEQPLFLQHLPQTLIVQSIQAADFCEFLAKPYCLLSRQKPPIRAGPLLFI